MPSTIRLKPNATIVFTGDSITAADRHRQAYSPLGCGYVHFTGNWLMAKYPALNLKIVNTGISGDTVIDLKRRWQSDCIAQRPDVLSILIGINDVWRRTMEPEWTEGAAGPDEFEITYDQLLRETEKRYGCQVILMEPFLFSRDRAGEVFRALGLYIEIVHRLAARHEALIVPLQSAIDRQIEEIPPAKWSRDGVHPYLWAHAWIAQRWLDTTGL